ncbi:MAG: transcription-repair coupling factor [Chitinivibrionales bacterium]|nr:transcription-repair coupling factor [Chitinivibrionales bacterium]MBD3356426.1 transcription-repair coupling factor [Chitinivibrionales bacterium]
MDIKNFRDIWKPGKFPGLRNYLHERPKRALFTGMAGGSDASLIAELYSARPGPVVVFVPNSRRGDVLAQECATFVGEENVTIFPSRDAIPYNMKSPFGPIAEARLQVLSKILDGGKHIVVAPAVTLLQRLVPPRELFNRIVRIEPGCEISHETLANWLTELGFKRETAVQDLGTFAIRGDIFDIYPFLTDGPVRLEYWGDTVDSIRLFDIYNQRSRTTLDSVKIFPMREFLPSDEDISLALYAIREFTESRGIDPSGATHLEHSWKSLGDIEGIEWFRHWFELPEASLLSYLPQESTIMWDDVITPRQRLNEARENYVRHLERVPDIFKPLVSEPDKILDPVDETAEKMGSHTCIYLDTGHVEGEHAVYATAFGPQPLFPKNLEPLFEDLKQRDEEGYEITMLCANIGYAERFIDLTAEECPFITVAVGYLENGFVDRTNKRVLYAENQIFRRSTRPVRRRKIKAGTPLTSFDSLSPGDYVVHVDHGIAQFRGMERVKTGAVQRDCMVLQYQGSSKVYVPVEDLNKVQKYIGKDAAPPALSKLGTASWERLKDRTRRSLKEMAEELIALYAKRQYLEGIRFSPDAVWQKEFEDAFIYEETPDQNEAIKEVKKDMESTKPMDRLICGDVGFGKTEVAMRAALKAAIDGYQVAVLAPTTILAAQHYATFSERMADFPVTIETLSRFRTAAEQRKIAKKLTEGSVDIVIGTHRILSKDIQFKNLGLLIVDEEQRFGVRHKEKLKQYRYKVDVLSMTATPIPRTLHLSLLGARDLSIINTPPRNRLPVETHVLEYHDEVLKSAIENELDRGGQVYVVHNRIGKLELLRDRIELMVPRARVIIAHGQMDEKELELIMREFVAGRFDVLLSTVIIENGLDIPNVNTIIINRADIMGLSQLYQLRGRVGRSSEQAYAYLLTPPFNRLDETALRRLRALEQYTDLGSGFQIAMRDLEIRGAGNILGTRQHGFIAAVGFEMYCRLLREAVDEIKGNVPAAEHADVKVDIAVEAFIPPEYIPDGSVKVTAYQELATVNTVEELNEFEKSLADRFGPLPEQMIMLVQLVAIRLSAAQLGVARISVGADRTVHLSFEGSTEKVGEKVKEFIAGAPLSFEVISGPPVLLKATLSSESLSDMVFEIRHILEKTCGISAAVGAGIEAI